MTDPRQLPADPSPGRGSQNTLYFIVGGLVVLVGIIAYVMFGGNGDTTTTVEEPAATTDTDTGTTGTTTETDTGTTTETTQ